MTTVASMQLEEGAPRLGREPGKGERREARGAVTHLFRASLLSLFCGGLGVTAIAAYAGDHKALAGALSIVLITPALLWALRHGFARFAMTWAVTLLLVVACVEVSIGDGIHDVGISLFTVVVLVSALLLDRRSSRLFSALSVLSVGVIGVAELTGVLKTRLSHAVSAGELSILLFLLGVFAILIHVVVRALHKGLDDAALNEQTYREIFEATTDGIAIHDADTGRIIDANAAACALWGFLREELLGRSLQELPRVGALRSDDAVLEDLLRRARREGPRSLEWKVRRKDGSEVWLDVALRAATIRGQECVLSAVRDISDRKAAAERLRAAEKLQTVGQLAGGVAHDFNNQLTAIMANASVLKDRLAGDPAESACIDAILHCCNRSADLTRQLLAFARKGDRREEVVDVDALVREVATLLERSIDKRVVLELDLVGDGSARIIGDASFLQSALLNLGLNARDAMPQGGTLRFSTRAVRAEALPAGARAQLQPSRTYVLVRVSDTGVGIGPDVLGRIFEPFFTTKPRGHGIGLAAAYGTVHAHRGAIVVESAPGAGTTFELLLPATEQALAGVHQPRASQPVPKLRVLLAEDERAVGRATEMLLQELGCSVRWCRDGAEALAAFERDRDGFDVVMLDHSMPRMLGSEVADRVAASRPALPIIATSGFAEGMDEVGRHQTRVFLPKPFDLDQLTAALGKALGRPPELARSSPSHVRQVTAATFSTRSKPSP